MLLSISDLTRFTAKARDASFPISDVFVSLSDRELSYLTIDTGGWFATDSVLLSANLITDISTDDRTLTLNVDEATIRSAPTLPEDSSSLVDALPPILIGPFGNTISPEMMAMMAHSNRGKTGDATARTRHLDRFSQIEGTDAFGKDGELGRVVDVLVSPDTHTLTHLVVDSGKVLSGRQLIVPIEKLRYQAEQETHLVFDLTSSELKNAPQMEYVDRIDRNWIDALRTYYQLPV